MPRNLDPLLKSALSSSTIVPVILVMLTFKSETTYCWSGIGTLVYGGNSYIGVGSLGKLGTITEGVSVQADGTSLTLSGIDPQFRSECMTDIQVGAPAKVWFGLWSQGQLVGSPYLIFSGTVDQPKLNIGGKTISVTLALENKMSNLSRASMRRYTAADQHLQYPDDTAFNGVEQLNDLSLVWGS